MGDRFWEVGLDAEVPPSEMAEALQQSLILNLEAREVDPDSEYHWADDPSYTIALTRGRDLRFLVSVVTPVPHSLLFDSLESFGFLTGLADDEAAAVEEHRQRFAESKALALIQLHNDHYDAKVAIAALLMERWRGVVVRGHAGEGPYVAGHGWLLT